MAEPNIQRPNYVLASVGAIAGAVLGYLAFSLFLKIGVYAMVAPGALIGLGCGAQARGHSMVLGVVSAVLALAVSLFVEWWFFPFVANESLTYFLANLGDLTMKAKLMIAAGVFAGFWFGRGR